MTLQQYLHHEEKLVHDTLFQHLEAAGIILIAIVLIIGLSMGAFVAAELHHLNP